VCGYQNDAGSSCMKLGVFTCNRAANQPNCGMDNFGGIFCNTVQWQCVK
jgi:hypothetical protein